MPPVTSTILTVIGDPELSAGADRIVAAVGARAIRSQTPSRTAWVSAAAVLLDEEGARRCIEAGLPRRDAVLVVASASPSAELWTTAMEVGARRVIALPEQESELVHRLADASETGLLGVRRGRVIAVVAGRGGAGASVFSAGLASCACEALLIDLDPSGGGIDLLLAGEGIPGLRWPDVRVQGGRLGWAAVREVLPRRDALCILSGTREFHQIEAGAVTAMVDAGRRGGATVVCDLPRQLTPAAVCALQCADLVVVVTSCDIRGIAATTALVTVLRTVNPALGLVVRGPSPGGLLATEVATAADAPLLAAMRPEPMLSQRLERGGLELRRRSPLAKAARAVLDLLGHDAERPAA